MIRFNEAGTALVEFATRRHGAVCVSTSLETAVAYLKVSETLEEFCELMAGDGIRQALALKTSVADAKVLARLLPKQGRRARAQGTGGK